MRPTHKCFPVIAMTCLAVSLSGCGGLRIHSEVRDKQGAETKEAWNKVDIAAVIGTERDNLNKLLATELETQDKLALAIRDHRLRAIVDGSAIDPLFVHVDKQLDVLVGEDGVEKVTTALNQVSKQRSWSRKLASDQEFWSDLRLGPSAPGCAEFEDETNPQTQARLSIIKASMDANASDSDAVTSRKKLAPAILEQIKVRCSEQPGPHSFEEMKGVLRDASVRQKADLAQAEQSKANVRNLSAAYAAAAKAYTDALPSGEPAVSKRTADALEELKRVVALLERAPDAVSRQFLSREKLQSLNDFVGAVTQSNATGKVPDDASKATVAFVLFPKLVDDAKKSLANAKTPLALPLLVQRNYEQLKLESLTREVAARQAMARIGMALVDTTFEQAQQLVQAKRELEAAAPQVKGMTPAAAFKVQNDAVRTSLYRGTALYLDALNRLEARRYKLEYQYIAAQHELQLAYAEVNAKQWSALISATVDQVAAAGAGGIKADRVVALLNMLGVFYIGHGVNK